VKYALRFALVVTALAFVVGRGSGSAQTMPPATPNPPPAANPADVRSVDAIVVALYDVISGPAEKARDWQRFYSLFTAGGQLVATSRRPDGSKRIRVLTPQEYVTASTPGMARRGFFEHEIGRTGETFNGIAQVFSAYESRWTLADPQPFERGVNSIQLYTDGVRWYIVSVFWAGDDASHPIPERYLGKHDTGG
jgi:hypothetical protein